MASGHRMPGAVRLAAAACMRIGAGVTTVVGPTEFMSATIADTPHIMYQARDSLTELLPLFEDERRNTAVIGPGMDADRPGQLRKTVLDLMALNRAIVLDAGALTAFAAHRNDFIPACHDRCVLTPHAGEFAKLFPDLKGGADVQASSAARLCDGVVVLKGPRTMIAAPDGRLTVNTHSSPWLATAGSGDVLAGIIAGLLAQGMSAFDAARAGVWIHGEAGRRIGAGLIAPDIIAALPGIMRDFA